MDSGSLAWVLVSAALVLFMTPGLAFFYGGMDRGRNVLNMLMMNFYCVLIIPVLWVRSGYSLSQGGVRQRLHRRLRLVLPRRTSDRRPATVAQLATRRLPRHVRGDHSGADLRRGRRPHEVLGMGGVRAVVVAARVRPDLQVGVRRLARRARFNRLRRRHRDPRQRRHRRPRRSAGARQAQGRSVAAALDAARDDRHRHPVVRLVRLQRRLGAWPPTARPPRRS